MRSELDDSGVRPTASARRTEKDTTRRRPTLDHSETMAIVLFPKPFRLPHPDEKPEGGDRG